MVLRLSIRKTSTASTDRGHMILRTSDIGIFLFLQWALVRPVFLLLASFAASANIFSAATWTAFVPCIDDDSLVPISMPSNEIGTPISLSTDFHPTAAAITPDGRRVLVTSGGTNNIAVLDLTQPSIEPAYVSVGATTNCVAITPDGRWALAVSGSSSVFVLNLSRSSVTLEKTISGLVYPCRVAITPDGTEAFITTSLYDQYIVYVFTIGTTGVEYEYSFSTIISPPFDVGISPDGTRALVSVYGDHYVEIVDLTQPIISGISYIVPVNDRGDLFLGLSPDGKIALVANGSIINVLDMTKPTIEEGYFVSTSQTGADGVAFSPDSTTAYISNSDGTVSVFDITATPIVLIDTIESVGGGPQGIVVSPDQAPTASFTMDVDGSTVFFDGLASSSPVGSIATYAWNFGDGTAETSSSPTVSHTYKKAGKYTVCLTVTNTEGTSTRQTFTGRTVNNNGGPSAMSSTTVEELVLFTGKIKKNSRKEKLWLQTKWQAAGSSSKIRCYQIFTGKKKIKTIWDRHCKKAIIHLHPYWFPLTMSNGYRTYLHNKYKIRVLYRGGKASSFTNLCLS